jgi:hypothetical protein
LASLTMFPQMNRLSNVYFIYLWLFHDDVTGGNRNLHIGKLNNLYCIVLYSGRSSSQTMGIECVKYRNKCSNQWVKSKQKCTWHSDYTINYPCKKFIQITITMYKIWIQSGTTTMSINVYFITQTWKTKLYTCVNHKYK